MSLSGRQRKQLQEALVSAFPTKSSLEQMLSFELDKNLEAIAGQGNLQEIVFKVIQTAEAQGWIEDLIRAARKSNPGNPKLLAITQTLGNLTYSQGQESITNERYTKLSSLLKEEKWEKADKETQLIMLKAANQVETGKLSIEDIASFPCSVLLALDRLWETHSNEKFGFSVQKKIFDNITLELNGDDNNIHVQFGKQVGWYLDERDKWLLWDELIYDRNAPKGHLPWRAVYGAEIFGSSLKIFGGRVLVNGKTKPLLNRNKILFERISTCSITEI